MLETYKKIYEMYDPDCTNLFKMKDYITHNIKPETILLRHFMKDHVYILCKLLPQ